ncbi:MAG: hypothetical protein ACFCU3_06690 [Verrucomicrobiales bacterium]
MQTHIRIPVAALCGFLLTTAALAEPPLSSFIQEDAMVCLVFEDLPGTVERWNRSPLGRLAVRDELRAFFAPSLRANEGKFPWEAHFEEFYGMSPQEVIALFQGPAVVSLRAPTPEDDVEDFFEGPPILLVGQVAGDKEEFLAYMSRDLQRLQIDLETEVEERLEEHFGVSVRVRYMLEEGEWDEMESWALVEDVVVFGFEKDTVLSTISSLINRPAEASLPGGLTWHRSKSRADSDVTLILDLAQVFKVWSTPMKDQMGEAMEGNPLGLQPDALMQALSLEGLLSFSMSLAFEPEEVVVEAGVQRTGPVGITRLLAYVDGPLATPSFFADDLMRFGVARFDLQKMVDTAIELTRAASPALGTMLEGQLDTMDGMIGMDLRGDLLSGIGADFLFAEQLRPSRAAPGEAPALDRAFSALETDLFYALSLSNRQGVETALNGVRNFMGQGLAVFQESEFLGNTIFTSPIDAESGIDFSYTLAGNYLFFEIGSKALLHKVLAQMQNSGPTIWEEPLIKAALEEGRLTSPPPASMEYMHLSPYLGAFLQFMGTLFDDEGGEDETVDMNALPPLSFWEEFFTHSISLSWCTDDGFFGRSRILKHQEESF